MYTRYSDGAKLGVMSLGRSLLQLILCGSIAFVALLAFRTHVRAESQVVNPSSPKHILVLHAYARLLPVYQKFDSAFISAMQGAGVKEGEMFFEYMDVSRIRDKEHMQAQAEMLRHKYSDTKIDLIVTLHAAAMHFVLGELKDFFPNAPMISWVMESGFKREGTERRVLWLLAGLDVEGSLKCALEFFPETKQVVFIGGANKAEAQVEEAFRKSIAHLEDRVQFEYTSNLSLEEMLGRVAHLPPQSIIIYGSVFSDKTGRSFTPKDVGVQVAKIANAPVFCQYDTILGLGAIGGSLMSFETAGTEAAHLAFDLLNGRINLTEKTDPIVISPVLMFDWEQLKRWGADKSNLPEGSILVNYSPSLFLLYRWHIVGLLTFSLAQSLLVVGLLINRRRRRSAEQSLRQKTKELDQFFNVSLDLLCIAKTEGYFLRLNPAWEKVLGYSREELLAKQFVDFVHPDDLERTSEAISTLASQQDVIRFENRYRSKDGTYRWLEWTSASAGNLIYAAARDLTERLIAEAEDQQRREELAHVTRIVMMGELTATLAHEINQPLTAIQSNAQAAQKFLAQSAPDINEVQQILDDIIRDDRRASDVVRKVRALVKKEKPCLELLDLNGLIQQVVDLIRGDSLLQGLSIQTDLSPGLGTIRGDCIQLQQVFLNLVLNGAAAMKNAAAAQRKIIVRTAMPNSLTVQAFVTDFGTGIDEHQIDRLFEPFYTTKPQGLGMGLSISQRIINAHGGSIEASNNPEGGATFALTLPAHQEDAL
jgi:PAS domain S-box-containing protein